MENKREPFKMVVEEIFTVTGRGTVVCGTKFSGSLCLYTPVEIHGKKGVLLSEVIGIEMFSPPPVNDVNRAILLKDISKDDVEVGDIIIEKIE